MHLWSSATYRTPKIAHRSFDLEGTKSAETLERLFLPCIVADQSCANEMFGEAFECEKCKNKTGTE